MSEPPKDREISRKEFFQRFINGVSSALFGFFEESLDAVEKAFPDIIRPPGALPEGEFLKTCNRCGDCWRACPHFVIRPVIRPDSFDEGTPQLYPWEAWCRMCPDLPCMSICKTGALRRPGEQPRIGLALVTAKACVRTLWRTCSACKTACPSRFDAILLGGPAEAPSISKERCTGCGACSAACPAPQKAIWIVPCHDLIHQYLPACRKGPG